MFEFKFRQRSFLMLMALLLLLPGCDNYPEVPPIEITSAGICMVRLQRVIPENYILYTSESMRVEAAVYNPNGEIVTLSFQAENGRMEPSLRTNSYESTYTAPDHPLRDTVTVTLNTPSCSSPIPAEKVQIEVIRKSHTRVPSLTRPDLSDATIQSSHTPAPELTSTPVLERISRSIVYIPFEQQVYTGFFVANSPYIISSMANVTPATQVNFLTVGEPEIWKLAVVEAWIPELLIVLLKPSVEPSASGFFLNSAYNLKVGEEVYVHSLRDEMAYGTVEQLDVGVRLNLGSHEVTISGLAIISKLGEAGDSGMPVFNKDNQVVGVIVTTSSAVSFMLTTDRLCTSLQNYLISVCPS